MADLMDDDTLWQAVYDARQSYFEATVGPLPDYMIRRAIDPTWPGGGLFEIAAPRLGPNLAVYTTFGLTNAGMSLRGAGQDVQPAVGPAAGTDGEVPPASPAGGRAGLAGYGYELLIAAEQGQQWPIRCLFELADSEIIGGLGLLAQVEAYDGVTMTGFDVALPEPGHLLIHSALDPLPSRTQLPNGSMQLLVATTITAEELEWSKDRRGALLQKLRAAGIGQVSLPGRPDIVLD